MERPAHRPPADQRRDRGGRRLTAPEPSADGRDGAGGLAEPAERAEAGEGVARDTPAPHRVAPPGERVEDGVEVRGDVETEELLVVARVADDGEAARLDEAGEAPQEASPADATRQRRDGY